jgi:hypothetical protein
VTLPPRASSHRAAQMARTSYSSLIDAWFAAGEEGLARACADLAVRQGVWTHPLQRDRDHVDGLTATPVHDPGGFWFVGHLEQRFAEISAEVRAVIGGSEDPVRPTLEDDWLLRSGSWEQAYLLREGEWQEQVCAQLPVTMAVLAEIPEMTTLSPGVILLSRLTPGTHIVPHCGSTNAVLRVHLPIIAPPGATIRVGDRTLSWEEGRCLVFDDSFEHEVWHRGTADRVVLIMDVLHPELDAARRSALIAHRPTVAQRVGAFMRDRGLSAVTVEQGRVGCSPDAPTARRIGRYLDELGTAGFALDGSGPRRHEPGRPEQG